MIRYAPYIDGTIPAFTTNDGIIIPFEHNLAVGKEVISGMVLMVKELNGTILGYIKKENKNISSPVIFDYQHSTLSLTVGQYYKIQLAYYDEIEQDEKGNFLYNSLTYSSVGITKYIGAISHNYDIQNNKFIFECEDLTETIFKSENKILLNDVEITNELLRNGFNYKKTNTITTINNYSSSKTIDFFLENNTLNLPTVEPLLTHDHKEEVTLIPLSNNNFSYKHFIRVNNLKDENYSIVSSPDATVEHGKIYYYGVINDNGDYLLNEEKPIVAYFEDMFLQDKENSLCIKFNPKISNFKPTIQETKQDTIGGKYPYFFRNGDMKYAEFPISGLISYHTQDSGKFILDEDLGFNNAFITRTETKNNDNFLLNHRNTNLTDNNIYAERLYREKVLEWLTNGKPKLFRSPTEGNFVVRLMNVSLSPEEKLGRMLWNFNCTAYECAPSDYQSLIKMNLVEV